MPTFTFTSPEGKKYDVTGPEGATKEQAFGILQQQLGSGTAKAAPVSPLDRLPPETSPTAQPQKNTDTLGQRILGAGEAGLSAATGAVGGAAGQLYGIGKTLASGKYGTQAGIQEGEKAGVELANKLTYQPRTQTGQQLTEGVGKALEASRLQGLPVEGGMLGRIPEVPGAALRTAEATGAVGKAGAQAAGRQAARGVAAALPAVDADTAQLAQKAHGMGFRLTPEQVVGGKYSKIAGESLASVPLSGASTELNKNVFLRNLSEYAGIEGGKPTRKAFGEATQRVGSGIGDLNQKYDLPIGKDTIPLLRQNAIGQLPEVKSVVNHYVDMVKKETKGGNLNGTIFRKINTEIDSRIKNTSNGDLKHALGELQDDLLDLQEAQMLPEDSARLNTLRRQYAIQRTIEPLASKSPTGDIAPAALLGAITSTKVGKARVARGAAGELGTLADIGARFLKEPKSSGTAERRLVQGIPAALSSAAGAGVGTAAGASALPAILGGVAGTYGAANLYNRAGPAITRALLERPPQ